MHEARERACARACERPGGGAAGRPLQRTSNGARHVQAIPPTTHKGAMQVAAATLCGRAMRRPKAVLCSSEAMRDARRQNAVGRNRRMCMCVCVCMCARVHAAATKEGSSQSSGCEARSKAGSRGSQARAATFIVVGLRAAKLGWGAYPDALDARASKREQYPQEPDHAPEGGAGERRRQHRPQNALQRARQQGR